jgi:hypothetical protein
MCEPRKKLQARPRIPMTREKLQQLLRRTRDFHDAVQNHVQKLSPTPALRFVTAFQSRRAMNKYLKDLSWETDVWVAESPSHLIHFDGERFLGPYL